VLTYSDAVLYNWAYIFPGSLSPTIDNIRCQTLFTGTNDEQEFQLVSARIELVGANLLPLMVRILDVPHGPSYSERIVADLKALADCIRTMRTVLLEIRSSCLPEVFYHAVRPWIRGQDVDLSRGSWVFEGALEAGLRIPTELSGPSAGQSSLIQALDVFLGVDAHTHVRGGTGGPAPAKKAFLSRMQAYMPAKHRAFLNALAEHPGAVRTRVEKEDGELLKTAYNETVGALKEFRDAHMAIAALFIAVPSRRARLSEEDVVVKGTGGTDMLKFLKSVRDQTTASIIASA
jgi:indoleamine 2,3-dioxygenase